MIKKILIYILLSVSILIIGFLSYNLGSTGNKIISIDDSLRHIKYAEYISKDGFYETQTNNSWDKLLVNNIYNEHNTDLWQGHHQLMSLLLNLGFNKIEANKFFCFFVLSIIFFIIITLNNYKKGDFLIGGIVFLLIFLINNDNFGRILLSRPFSMTVILFILLLISLYNNKKIFVLLLFMISTYYHMVFYIMFLPVFLYYIFGLNNKNKILICSIVGFILGLLIHYNSLDYLSFSFISFFYIPLIHIMKGFGAGEIVNLGVDYFLLFGFGGLIITATLDYIYGKSKDILEKRNFFIYSITLLLGLLSLLIGRFSDFFYISMSFSSIIIINSFLSHRNINIYSIIHIKKYLANTFIFTIILFTLFFKIQGIDKSLINLNDYQSFFETAVTKMEKGKNILSNDYLDFSLLYYFLGSDYKYLNSMEIYYMYLKDKKGFSDIKDVTYSHMIAPKNKDLDLYEVLKNNNINYYIILKKNSLNYTNSELLKYKIIEINNNPKFELLTSYNGNYLWKLK